MTHTGEFGTFFLPGPTEVRPVLERSSCTAARGER
jgi:hypothetical protein